MPDQAHRHEEQQHPSIKGGGRGAQPAVVETRGSDVGGGAEQHPCDLADPVRASAEDRHHAESGEHEHNQRLQAVNPRHQARIEPTLSR